MVVCIKPVFFVSVEPSSATQQEALDKALVNLQREDPSLLVEASHCARRAGPGSCGNLLHAQNNPETGQLIIKGMGELHLEIVKNRLKSDFNVGSLARSCGWPALFIAAQVQADVGRVQIAYREGIAAEADGSFSMQTMVPRCAVCVCGHLACSWAGERLQRLSTCVWSQ